MPIGRINDKSALFPVSTCFRQAKADFHTKLCGQMAWLGHNEEILFFSYYVTFGVQTSHIHICRKKDIWGDLHEPKLQIHNTFIAWGCTNSSVTNTQTINSDSGISINKAGISGDQNGKLHSTFIGSMGSCFIVGCIQGSYWSSNAQKITMSAKYHSFSIMIKYQTFTISPVCWGKRDSVQTIFQMARN